MLINGFCNWFKPLFYKIVCVQFFILNSQFILRIEQRIKDGCKPPSWYHLPHSHKTTCEVSIAIQMCKQQPAVLQFLIHNGPLSSSSRQSSFSSPSLHCWPWSKEWCQSSRGWLSIEEQGLWPSPFHWIL